MSQLPAIQNDFVGCTVAKPQNRLSPKKRSVSVSFRATEEEHAQLKKDAGDLAVSTYLRKKLLGDKAVPRKAQYTRKQKQPNLNSAILAQWLGMLGQSELTTSLMALAMAAQSGSLPVTEELESSLQQSCEDVHAMRIALIMALQVKPEDGQ